MSKDIDNKDSITNITIRKIKTASHRTIKSIAADRGVPIASVVEDMLEFYIANGGADGE